MSEYEFTHEDHARVGAGITLTIYKAQKNSSKPKGAWAWKTVMVEYDNHDEPTSYISEPHGTLMDGIIDVMQQADRLP